MRYVHCNEVKEDATTPKEEGETDSACLLIPEDKEVRKLKIEQLRLTNENLAKDSYYKSLQILQLERALKTRNSDYTSHLDDEFTVFTKDSRVSWLDNGKLYIQPIMMEERYSEALVNIGTLNLEGCTSPIPEECSRQATGFLILPPVMSARVKSKNSFSFRYGTVEIRAKLPRGDWIVPELWLEPANSNLGANWGRMVLGMARGNTDVATTENNRLLEAGVLMNSSSQYSQLTRDVRWGQDFHTYRLVWSHDRLEFSVDGQPLTTLTSNSGLKSSFFTEEFYITLGVHVAGGRDFPDSMRNKPWKNTHPKRFVNFWLDKQSWRPTWDRDSALQIESVKVTAL
ncbi:Hydrolase activity protein [Homalodisca vitripennis]|nr:Hydrolase activity protein [Homalodisca vitripennis]